MAFAFDAVVVGAGVVGLAAAKYLAESGLSTLVLESEASFGTATSSRNSEVIHAGIYYPYDSLKARLCTRGKSLLYDYCSERSIPNKKIGKWIVAQSQEDVEILHRLKRAALDNGVTDLKFLSAKAVSTEEPELSAAEVLYSPSTGVLDTHAYMQSLVADIETAGGLIVYKTACLGAEIAQNGFQINIGGTDPTLVRSKYLINAAGLNAIPFAEKIKGLSKNTVPQACFAKGNYYTYLGKVPFVRLIYPVPEVGGLGIHLTIDINGQARFGPDVEWVSHIDYQVNDKSKQEFARAIQTYWPSCDAKKLMPAYSGIRPKIGIPEQFSKDFVIQTEIDHGVAGLINLYGIESPGLTASLAIAEQVFSFIKEVRN